MRILSDFILYGNVLLNSIPRYVKSDTTLQMLHMILRFYVPRCIKSDMTLRMLHTILRTAVCKI